MVKNFILDKYAYRYLNVRIESKKSKYKQSAVDSFKF
jgi:hypothetical protein